MLWFHGYGKLMGGPERWEAIGGSMANFGITFLPVLWGFMAAFAEFGGSILIITGLWMRVGAFLLIGTMFVAAVVHLNMPPESPRAGWKGASHALELLCVYVALFISGPGCYAVRLWKTKSASDPVISTPSST